ncbi:sucrose-6-phosphate hydrolase [Lachnospiraceae bacterium KM106-2]|nr:sucrose-6-phosphate hydrolase [Lachnospiraceae bacterium KM106-2]
MIGWCGLPDIDEEYTNKTVETGWQHALSLPRKVLIRDGHVCQMPHDEFNELRRKKSHILIQGEETIREIGDTFDLELKNATNNAFTVTIDEHLQLLYENGCFTMSFDDANISGGRTERKLLCDQVRKMRVVADTSLLEVYLNDGESVFTTRFYPNSSSIQVRSKNCILDVWELVGMSMNIKEEEMGENE